MEREEAIKIVKSHYSTNKQMLNEALEFLIPELKESEDERIRKALLEMVHDTTGDELWVDYNVHKEDALAWIEKQGEQKPSWSEEDERLRYSCIKHIEEELEEIGKDKFGHSEIISDLKESCRERIDWLKSLKERLL